MWRWMTHSLQRKLSFIMLVSTLIPLLFLGGFAFNISSDITEEKAKQAGMDTLQQMEANLRFILQDIESMSIFLIGQRDIQQHLSAKEGNFNEETRILGFTTNLVSSKEYISNITIYPNDPDMSPLSTTTIYASDLGKYVDLKQVTGKMWTPLYTVRDYSGERQVISFIRPLRSIDNYQNLGYLSISLDEKVIFRNLSEPRLGNGQGHVALLNDQGVVLSATDKSWLSTSLESLYPGVNAKLGADTYGTTIYGEGNDKKTILYYREPTFGWTLIGMIPYEIYSEQNRYIIQLTAAAVVLTIAANTALILFLVQRVTNPLRLLTRLLTKVNPNEPLPVYPTESADEIGRLAASYNLLGTHIEVLKEQVIRNESRKKEADLQALQAQINPHFLYNTLSSIHWMALMTEERRIADMVEALSDFLRFSLNKGKDFCPVHQELAHIKNYAQVQAIRYPDKFDIDSVVDPDLQDKYMLKLLLQPLVENALIHGIQKKEGRGTITLYVERKGDRMSFLVLDDGVGMSEERLQWVKSNLQTSEEQASPDASYGLRNVNERLLLHYGVDSQLVLESKQQAGTRISFSIPIVEVSDENHDRG